MAMFRARDVRANVKELGWEKGLEMSLTLMADEMIGIRQTLTELTAMQEKFIDLIGDMGIVTGALATKLHDMSRIEDQFQSTKE